MDELEYEDEELDGLNDETFGDMDETFELGALPAFFGSQPETQKKAGGAALLLRPDEIAAMDKEVKRKKEGRMDEYEVEDDDEEEEEEEMEDKNLIPQNLLSNNDEDSQDLSAQLQRNLQIQQPPRPPMPQQHMRPPMLPPPMPFLPHPRGPPAMLMPHPRGPDGQLLQPRPPPGFVLLAPPPGWKPGMHIPIIPVNAIPRGPPRPAVHMQQQQQQQQRQQRQQQQDQNEQKDFPSLADAAKVPRSKSAEQQQRQHALEQEQRIRRRQQQKRQQRQQRRPRPHAYQRQQPSWRPQRMHMRSLNFVIKCQMRAINAITEEDDFYFERWQEKQKRMRGLMSLQESLSQPVRAGSSKRGDNKVRDKAERGKSFDNLQSRRIKSRAWAETQKTLGMTSAANLRAPRKLLTIQRNDTTSNDESKALDGPDAAVAESSFAGPFWASRIMIEEAMTAVMKVEDKLSSSNSNNDDEEDELEELREQLGNALKLPSDFDIKEEGWPASAGHQWEALNILGSIKGKKLLLRAIPLLSHSQTMTMLWIVSRYLHYFLFTAEKDSSELDAIHAKMSESLYTMFTEDDVPIAILVKCLTHFVTDQHYPAELLVILLNNANSAHVLEGLLGSGEAASKISDDSAPWQNALALLQSRAAQAAQAAS